MMATDAPILAVDNLVTTFRIGGGWHPAVRDVSFDAASADSLSRPPEYRMLTFDYGSGSPYAWGCGWPWNARAFRTS